MWCPFFVNTTCVVVSAIRYRSNHGGICCFWFWKTNPSLLCIIRLKILVVFFKGQVSGEDTGKFPCSFLIFSTCSNVWTLACYYCKQLREERNTGRSNTIYLYFGYETVCILFYNPRFGISSSRLVLQNKQPNHFYWGPITVDCSVPEGWKSSFAPGASKKKASMRLALLQVLFIHSLVHS